jgi:phospholipid transport system substrate-binding protein
MPAKKSMLIFMMVFLLFSFQTVPAAIAGPTEQLRTTVDQIIETLRDKNLSQEAILEKVADLVRQKFDFRAMSQRTLGINWRKATPQEQDRFVDLFAQLLEDTYRGRIKAYTYKDEKVEYLGERIRDSRAEVDTVIVANRDIPVSYRMRLKGDEWLVYDVIIEEVSLINNFRNSYAEIIRDEGFSGLLSRMEEKIRQMQISNQAEAAGQTATGTQQ